MYLGSQVIGSRDCNQEVKGGYRLGLDQMP